MTSLLFNIVLTNSVIFSFGAMLSLFFFKERVTKDNISEIPIFGIILLSIITLFINFFFPINKIIGTTVLILGLIFLTKIIINNSNINQKIFKNIFLSSIVCFLILSYSNVYRPDAGLYHLPYISIINENKIIAGVANINFRYALASIVQYLSASQNNYIYSLEAISIPLASIFSFSIIFFIGEIFKNIKIKKNINSLIIFLISVYCFISFGRFSNYGNDAISHLYFFILIVFIINNFQNFNISNLKLNKLSLIAIFLFAAKPFMFLIILLPLLFFLYLKNKKELFKTKLFYLNSVFLILWILKSITISGCIIYPVDKTCFKSLKIYDEEKTIIEAKSGEAWAKGWINQENVILNFEEYNQNFNWIHTWKKVHLKKIIEKLLPYIIFLTILLIVFIFQDKKKYKKLPSEINFIFLISIFLTLVWFLKFPLYRYGASFIVMFIICIFTYLIYYSNLIPKIKNLVKIFKIFIFICIIAFMIKNFLRIDKNLTEFNNKIWPDIYSEGGDYKINEFKLIKNGKKELYYFSSGKLCMYSKAPCSNYLLKKLDKKEIYGYQLYWKTE